MSPVIFKIATCNLQSLPHLPSIRKQLESAKGVGLRGFQECDPRDYKAALFKRYPNTLGIGTKANPKDKTYSCPVAVNASTFTAGRARSVKIYDGHEGISYTRHLTTVPVTHRRSKYVVGFINLHSVVTHGKHQAQRKAMKAETKRVLLEEVRRYTARSIPVAITGDFNDSAPWFGKTFDGHAVTVIGHGIDKIILIDGKQKWDVLSIRDVETPSDHDTKRAKVSLG